LTESDVAEIIERSKKYLLKPESDEGWYSKYPEFSKLPKKI
jgi:hypothetical protein